MAVAEIRPTTFRIDPAIRARLKYLSEVLGKRQNELVNEALKEYVARRSELLARELEKTAKRLRAYNQADPDFDAVIKATSQAEGQAKKDPAEGELFKQVKSSVREHLEK